MSFKCCAIIYPKLEVNLDFFVDVTPSGTDLFSGGTAPCSLYEKTLRYWQYYAASAKCGGRRWNLLASGELRILEMTYIPHKCRERRWKTWPQMMALEWVLCLLVGRVGWEGVAFDWCAICGRQMPDLTCDMIKSMISRGSSVDRHESDKWRSTRGHSYPRLRKSIYGALILP